MNRDDAIELLRSGAKGVAKWNGWRATFGNREPPIDLTGANLEGAFLEKAVFFKTDLTHARLGRANLHKTSFVQAKLIGAHLSHANLKRTSLNGAKLQGACLTEADISSANLICADFTDADLRGASLRNTTLTRAKFCNANLDGCEVYGASVWDVNMEGASQNGLLITSSEEPAITVDNLKVAHFIYLLLENSEIRDVIDTITSKVVLILGRFTQTRKDVLDVIRVALRAKGYSPIMFDFEKPESRSFRETVSTLAHLARFVIADLTGAKVVLQELERILPNLPSVPVQPIKQSRAKVCKVVGPDYSPYPWFLPIIAYRSAEDFKGAAILKILTAAEALANKTGAMREPTTGAIGKRRRSQKA